MLQYLNGRFVEEDQAVIPVQDRGFIFGDGVYEVWRVVDGALFEAERHQARLERGLRELQITQPRDTTAESIRRIADRMLEANGITSGHATLYLQVTRGAAPRTHAFPPAGTPPTVFLSVKSFTPDTAHQRAGAAAITVPDIRWLRCDIKTVQLLPNVMANQRASEAGVHEAIFIRDGRITEGTHTNVFGVLDGVLRTHPADRFVLPGITRGVLLELAGELAIPTAEIPIATGDVPRLQELFITGTSTDVTPIVRLDGKPVGTGAPGPVAMRLLDALHSRLAAAAAPATR